MMRKAWHAIWLVLISIAMLNALIECASAQSYPNGQIKILVGFPPGGTTDIIARDVGQELGEGLAPDRDRREPRRRQRRARGGAAG